MHRVFLSFALAALTSTGTAPATTLNLGGGPGPQAESAQLNQPAPANNAAAARLPERSETSRFDNWAVTCEDFADAPKKHVCNAVLRAESSGNLRLVFVWTLYINDRKQLVGALQTPTGVMLTPGVEIEFENAKDAKKESKSPKHKFVYESCDPSWCFATLNLDKTFIREATSASSATAIIQARNGNTIRFKFPNKGFDKAYAQLTANAN